ncbi:hypothetical protein HOH87_01245 [bacterium]|jgi:hypothetical protein|nr:hypothetical protein [bacterium]
MFGTTPPQPSVSPWFNLRGAQDEAIPSKRELVAQNERLNATLLSNYSIDGGLGLGGNSHRDCISFGDDIAYVASKNRISILNRSDDGALDLLGEYNGVVGPISAIDSKSGRVVFIDRAGMHSLDVSDPSNPVLDGTNFSPTDNVYSRSEVQPEISELTIVDDGVVFTGVDDIFTKLSITEDGSFTFHSAVEINTQHEWTYEIVSANNIVYVIGLLSRILYTLDATDNLELLNQVHVGVTGNSMTVTDDQLHISGWPDEYQMVDISTPGQPIVSETYRGMPYAKVLKSNNNTLFSIGNGYHGVKAYEYSNGSSPSIVGTIDESAEFKCLAVDENMVCATTVNDLKCYRVSLLPAPPSVEPTFAPTHAPSGAPTSNPTRLPVPSETPTFMPTPGPTPVPSETPTWEPSSNPTEQLVVKETGNSDSNDQLLLGAVITAVCLVAIGAGAYVYNVLLKDSPVAPSFDDISPDEESDGNREAEFELTQVFAQSAQEGSFDLSESGSDIEHAAPSQESEPVQSGDSDSESVTESDRIQSDVRVKPTVVVASGDNGLGRNLDINVTFPIAPFGLPFDAPRQEDILEQTIAANVTPKPKPPVRGRLTSIVVPHPQYLELTDLQRPRPDAGQ